MNFSRFQFVLGWRWRLEWPHHYWKIALELRLSLQSKRSTLTIGHTYDPVYPDSCILLRLAKEVLPGFTRCCQSNIINDTKISSENENASLGYSHFCKFLWILFLLAHFFISSPICYVTKLKMSSSVLRNRPRVLQRRKKSSEEHRSMIRKIREVGKNES